MNGVHRSDVVDVTHLGNGHEPKTGHHGGDLFEHDLQLQPGQARSNTEVRAEPQANVAPSILVVDDEVVGIFELRRITIGRMGVGQERESIEVG